MTKRTHYSPKEAAKATGLSKKTILRYIRNGTLPVFRLNQRVLRIPIKHVDRLAGKGLARKT